jgi:uncharacterized membrane protein YkoI
VALALALMAAAAWAGSPPVPAGRAAASAPPRHLSMDQAVSMVERRYKGRVVRAESVKDAGQTVYVLRVLDRAGRVFTVQVEASSGRIL